MKKELFAGVKALSVFKIALVLSIAVLVSSCDRQEQLQPAEARAASKSIVDVLGGSSHANARAKKPTFSTLNVALARTGLASAVSSNQLTVFAPTDEAFAELGLYPNNVATALPIETLKSILLYHVVAGKVYSTDLTTGPVPTLLGQTVMVDLTSGVMVNDANVIVADIEARNGVIHAIDKILMPN
ncbi:hypothetical protein GCM10023189_03320 [Nibrella saemangeumensis]|uniref:FAS1 domain-containing protein n=1 Tax=Nibrella saemangeumensis TaxID=1084526 RepID=A0ABP8MDD1_9BACT